MDSISLRMSAWLHMDDLRAKTGAELTTYYFDYELIWQIHERGHLCGDKCDAGARSTTKVASRYHDTNVVVRVGHARRKC